MPIRGMALLSRVLAHGRDDGAIGQSQWATRRGECEFRKKMTQWMLQKTKMPAGRQAISYSDMRQTHGIWVTRRLLDLNVEVVGITLVELAVFLQHLFFDV